MIPALAVPGDLVDDFVGPFYLAMMGTNAATAGPVMLADVRERARRISDRNIARLLLSPWRPRVMGTWYAVAAPRPRLAEVVHQSLRTSAGALTAPALLVAVLHYADGTGAGADAGTGVETSVDAIDDYHRRDLVAQWGVAGLARAAADVLAQRTGTPSRLPAADAADRRTLGELLAVAEALRSS